MSIEPNDLGFWEKTKQKKKQRPKKPNKHIKKHTPRYQEEQIEKLKPMDIETQ